MLESKLPVTFAAFFQSSSSPTAAFKFYQFLSVQTIKKNFLQKNNDADHSFIINFFTA